MRRRRFRPAQMIEKIEQARADGLRFVPLGFVLGGNGILHAYANEVPVIGRLDGFDFPQQHVPAGNNLHGRPRGHPDGGQHAEPVSGMARDLDRLLPAGAPESCDPGRSDPGGR